MVWSSSPNAFRQRHPASSHSQGTPLTRSILPVMWHCSWCSGLPLTQMVSLANEVQSFHTERQKDVSSFTKSSVVGGLSEEPSFYGVLSYSYCYLGIMTGESVAPPPDAALLLCLSIISVVLLFAFAWTLTAVSLCLTLLHLSNTVWVHMPFSLTRCRTCFCKRKLSSSPIAPQTSNTLLTIYWCACSLQTSHDFVNYCLPNTPLSHPTILSQGPFFRYQTYADWLRQPNPQELPGREPCLQRLKLVPVYSALFLAVNSVFPLAYVRTEEFLEQNFFFRCWLNSHFFFRLFFFCFVFFVYWCLLTLKQSIWSFHHIKLFVMSTSNNIKHSLIISDWYQTWIW